MAENAMSTSPYQTRMLINGGWHDAASGEEITVENPGRKTAITSVPRGAAADVERAVQAAATAFVDWSRVAPRERGRALQKIADVVEQRVEELARILAEETGNALRTQARPEANGVADIIRYYGGLGSELKGETIPIGEQVLSYTRREPIGVVGAIVPWNAPALLSCLKIAPAILCGNTRCTQCHHRLRRRVRCGARGAPRSAKDVLHRFYRGRQVHHESGVRQACARIA